jgi:hypothetical protein
MVNKNNLFLGTVNNLIKDGIVQSLTRTFKSLGNSEADVQEFRQQLSKLDTQQLLESVQLMGAYTQSQLLEQATKNALEQQRQENMKANNWIADLFRDN